MSKIVFLVFMCPGTLSLSTPVDADGSDLSQCCFLSCFVAFFVLFCFFLRDLSFKKMLCILYLKISIESVGWAVLFMFFA